MAGTTKKEHYVPRCYLERWKNEKGQVSVFDKVTKKARTNNIYDVACKRYYYDIDPKSISKFRTNMLKKLGIDSENDSQFIEHFLGKHVEGVFSELLSKIVTQADHITPWYENNCCFISDIDKIDFSVCLAFQYIRADTVRNSVIDSSNCLTQALHDMHASQEIINKYTIKQGDEKDVHGNLLLDFESIAHLAEGFHNLTWILRINHTDVSFYTSDNPIGTFAHVNHPFMPMSGIRSKGVEVFFPISPKYILIMYDGSYHKYFMPYDRRYISLTNLSDIEYYNSMSALESNRFIFSCNGDFNIIEHILSKNSEAFNISKTKLTWGGKEYIPNKQL